MNYFIVEFGIKVKNIEMSYFFPLFQILEFVDLWNRSSSRCSTCNLDLYFEKYMVALELLIVDIFFIITNDEEFLFSHQTILQFSDDEIRQKYSIKDTKDYRIFSDSYHSNDFLVMKIKRSSQKMHSV